jgi:hypothetical protein
LERGEVKAMKTYKGIGTATVAVILLTMGNVGCAAKQPEIRDTWTEPANRSAQAASRAEDAAKRAEAAAARTEAAVQKIENVAGKYNSSLERSLNK